MKYIAILLSFVVFSSAHAWDCNYWSQSSNPKAECYKVPQSGSSAAATQTQGQGQQQGQGQGQSQQSANTNENANKNSNLNTSASNSTSSSTSTTSQGNAQTIEIGGNKVAAASANAGIGDTTAQCRFHDGAGLQLIGVGFSFGKSRADRDCRRLAYAEKLLAMGDTAAANRLLCSIPDIRSAMGDTVDECLAVVNQLHPVQTSDNATTYVTREELTAVVKHGLIK